MNLVGHASNRRTPPRSINRQEILNRDGAAVSVDPSELYAERDVLGL